VLSYAHERAQESAPARHAGPSGSRLAGEWRSAARRRGETVATTDALDAATAYQLGAVLTRNVRDFALTPVRVETY
jgi:predicted nucleic acid-binding protein